MDDKERYNYRKAHGLCVTCGRVLAEYETGLRRVRCRRCREVQMEYRRAQREAAVNELQRMAAEIEVEPVRLEYPELCNGCEWAEYCGEGIVYCLWRGGTCAKRSCRNCVNRYGRTCTIPGGEDACKDGDMLKYWSKRRE